jgi:hypothetical protein
MGSKYESRLRRKRPNNSFLRPKFSLSGSDWTALRSLLRPTSAIQELRRNDQLRPAEEKDRVEDYYARSRDCRFDHTYYVDEPSLTRPNPKPLRAHAAKKFDPAYSSRLPTLRNCRPGLRDVWTP